MPLVRTDLAVEAKEIAGNSGELKGVECIQRKAGDVTISRVRVLDREGEKRIGKPAGTYVTVEVPNLSQTEDDSFYGAVEAVADELKQMLEPFGGGLVLVAGLGNAMLTPDALGPRTVRSVLVTRHVTGEIEKSGAEPMRPVAAVAPGVLGQTGVEAGEILKALVQKLTPDVLVAVDALASRRASRLGNTIQLADTGIIPGSGVGNSRFAINRESLGIPVISIGVPTVVDAATLAVDLLEGAGYAVKDGDESKLRNCSGPGNMPMFVTPRFIDLIVEHAARLTGFAIDRALNPSIPVKEIAELVS